MDVSEQLSSAGGIGNRSQSAEVSPIRLSGLPRRFCLAHTTNPLNRSQIVESLSSQRRSARRFSRLLRKARTTASPSERANAAVMQAEALSHKPGYVGAIAFSRSGDPATLNFGDAMLIRKFGDVPDNLSAL